MPSTILEQLLELQQRAEVLVDAGAYTLGEGERWMQVRKVRPNAPFPVYVSCGAYRLGEIRGVREHGRV